MTTCISRSSSILPINSTKKILNLNTACLRLTPLLRSWAEMAAVDHYVLASWQEQHHETQRHRSLQQTGPPALEGIAMVDKLILSVVGCGLLQLGVPHWATSVDYCK